MARPKKGKGSVSGAGAAGGDLLLEIGTEELPYQFIAPALHALGEAAERTFKEHRLGHGAVRTFGTPRRLVLSVEGLAGRQTAAVKEAMGPSKAIAYDASGAPTKALAGFMAGQGVTTVETRQTPKGEYVFAVKRDEGRPAMAVLAELLPGLITGLNFPKAMKWNEEDVRFARPIRWLLAVCGGKPVPFTVGGVSSGNRTRAHRFLNAAGTRDHKGLAVGDLASYLKTLERRGVIPEQEKRRAMILAQVEKLAGSVKGQPNSDEDLLEQAVYTVEYPHAILGGFKPQYLSLPKEIIVTAMKEHQGFFSLSKRDGTLLPHFVSVTNMKLPDMTVIRRGNERVLAARLADAKFFFEEDRKIKLADRVEKLKGVVFHQKIGTQYQRTRRLMDLGGQLLGRLRDSGWTIDENEFHRTCRRAAELSKADLLTDIVGEFPALQGIMGGVYAKHDGESDEVCLAIAEQYLPRTADDRLPKTKAGTILSIADRLDAIFTFFTAGLIPSGSEDPFGLRRHALAIVRILIEKDIPLVLGAVHAEIMYELIEEHASIKRESKTDKTAENDPINFILDRLRFYGRTADGLRDDIIDAVLQGEIKKEKPISMKFKILDLYSRMKALQKITNRPEFDPLMVGFKRAHRIVEKEKWKSEEINPSLFQHATEVELHKAVNEANLKVLYDIERVNHAEALNGLVGLRAPIDAFFNSVMVNTEEQGLRKNRLSLLYAIDRLFMSFADFSQIAVQGA